MRYAVAILFVTALAACGGAGNNANIGAHSEDDLHYEQLIEACHDAEKLIPHASDWNAVLEEVTYQNDGREEMYALASEYSKALPPEKSEVTAEEFLAELKEERQAREAEPNMSPAELDVELRKTDAWAERFSKLIRFDSLAVLAPREGWSRERDMAVAKLLSAMCARPRLLVQAGSTEQAEEELVTYLVVLGKLDRNSRLWSRSLVNSDIARVLVALSQGWLQPLAGSEKVHAALDTLYEVGNLGRKRAWLREFKYLCAFYLQTPKSELFEYMGDSRRNTWEGLTRSLAEFRYDLELAGSFDLHAPDLLDSDDVEQALRIADSYYHGVKVLLSDLVMSEWRLQAAWLGYSLCLLKSTKPLVKGSKAVAALTKKYPGTRLVWSDDKLQVGADNEAPAAEDGHYSEFIPTITIDIH